MKVVILAGGFGSRVSEESHLKPKPMIEIGGKPILWHIMKIYQSQGFNEFIICLGYKGYVIKEYFANYFLHNSDVTFDLANNKMTIHDTRAEDLKVTLVETGLETMTAGRIKAVEKYIDGDFHLTYGDGVADINLKKLVDFHQSHNKIATVTAVSPPGRFGALGVKRDGQVDFFREKPTGDTWINGGFFVLKKAVFDYLQGDLNKVPWEHEPLEKIQHDNQLVAYKHIGFWKCMDTLRDKIELEEKWRHNPVWKIWE